MLPSQFRNGIICIFKWATQKLHEREREMFILIFPNAFLKRTKMFFQNISSWQFHTFANWRISTVSNSLSSSFRFFAFTILFVLGRKEFAHLSIVTPQQSSVTRFDENSPLWQNKFESLSNGWGFIQCLANFWTYFVKMAMFFGCLSMLYMAKYWKII